MTVVQKPKSVTNTDDVLVERARRGDDEAFQTLYLRHYDYVEGLLLRLFGNADDLEDVLQETFLTALEHLDHLRDPSKVRGWFTAIAVNCAKRALTKKHKRLRFTKLWSGEPTRLASPPDRLSLSEAYAALDRLSPKLRVPWMLNRVEGFTLPEVAAILNTSRSTVKRRIAAAEARLQRLLDVD